MLTEVAAAFRTSKYNIQVHNIATDCPPPVEQEEGCGIYLPTSVGHRPGTLTPWHFSPSSV